jgi:urea transport system substrate-binding protein
MARQKWLSCALVVTIAVITFGGLPIAQAAQPVKIGVPIELSGDFGVYGEAMKQGTELALKEINDAGGILGRPVQAVYADIESKVQPTIDKVTALIQRDNVDVLIGIISSASRDAVVPVVFREKKILIYPTTYEGGVAAKFKDTGAHYVFTTGPVSEQYIKPFIPWLIKNKGKSFYMLGMDYIYGQGSVENAKKYVADAGGTVVGSELIPLGTTDFSAVLNRVVAAKPDVLFAVEAGDDLLYLVKQYNEFDLRSKNIFFATSELDESYMKAMGADNVKGIACSYPYFMVVETPENQKFLEEMRTAYGQDVLVSLATESQYYSVKLFAQAAQKAGSLDTEALISALETVSITAPEGKVSIRKEDHQAIVNDVIAVIEPDVNQPYAKWFKIQQRLESIEPELQGMLYSSAPAAGTK